MIYDKNQVRQITQSGIRYTGGEDEEEEKKYSKSQVRKLVENGITYQGQSGSPMDGLSSGKKLENGNTVYSKEDVRKIAAGGYSYRGKADWEDKKPTVYKGYGAPQTFQQKWKNFWNDDSKLSQEKYTQKRQEALQSLEPETLEKLKEYETAVRGYNDIVVNSMLQGSIPDTKVQVKYAQQQKELKDELLKNYGISEKDLPKLLEYVSEEKDAELQEKQKEWIKEETTGGSRVEDVANSIALNFLDIAATPVRGIGAVGETLINRAGLYADPEAPVNTNSRNYALSNFNENVVNQTSENIQNAGGGELGVSAYNIAKSTGESAYRIAIGGGLSSGMGIGARAATLTMGSADVYASSLKDAQERGANDKQAITYAAARAMGEAATEVVSLDHFWDIAKKSGSRAAKNAVVDVLAQAGIEGSEEVGSELIGLAADAAINMDKSVYNTSVREYMEQGATEEQAKKQATRDAWDGIFESFIGGTISGGVMGTGAQGFKTIADSSAAKDFFEQGNYAEFAQTIDTDPASYKGNDVHIAEETRDMAQALAKKQEAGEEITTKEKRQLYNRMQDMVIAAEKAKPKPEKRRMKLQDIFGRKKKTAGKKTQEQSTEKSDLPLVTEEQVPEKYRQQKTNISQEQAYKDMTEAATAEELVGAYQRALNSADPSVVESAERIYQLNQGRILETGKATAEDFQRASVTEAQAYLMGANGESGENLQGNLKIAYNEGSAARIREDARRNIADVQQVKQAKATGTGGRRLQIAGIKSVSAENAVLETSGGEIPMSEVKFDSGAIQRLYNRASEMENTELAKTYLESYPGTMPISVYTEQFQAIKNAGQLGTSYEKAAKNSILSQYVAPETMKKIYTQAEGLRQKSKETEKKAPRKAAGKVIDQRENKQESPYQKIYEIVARKTGQDVVLTDETDRKMEGVNGSFSRNAATFVFNLDSDYLGSTLMHEMGEFAEEWNTVEMRQFQNDILEYIAEKGTETERDRLVRSYQRIYAAKEGSKEYRAAAEEMVNDSLAGLFYSERGLNDFAEWMTGTKGAQHTKTVFEKFADFLKSLVEKFHSMLKDSRLPVASRITAQMEADRAEGLRRRFLEIVDQAKENYEKSAVETENGNGTNAYSLVGVDEDGIEVYETSEETKKLPYSERKKKLLNLMKQEFRGRTAKFWKNGEAYYALYDKAGINKGLFGDKKSNKSGMNAKLNIGADGNYIELAENAIYQRSSREQGKENPFHKNAKSWDYFIKSIKSDGRYFDVLINVKDTGEDQYVYDITLKEVASPSTTLSNGYLSLGRTTSNEAASPYALKHLYSEKATSDAQSIAEKEGKGKEKFSLALDDQGNNLTPEQQTFFKNSKVRDENGSLKVMYHGTPQGGFTVFKNDLTFFTDNEDYADVYTDTSASSRNSRKSDGEKKIYEVYLNITKPFDIRMKRDREIFINDYVKGGYALGINPYVEYKDTTNTGLPSWEEADNIYEFLEENDLLDEYDGIVVDEGGIPTEDGVKSRGISYVTFSPEQIKSIDNEKPTEDPDIRFSLKGPVEETRDLIALHNLSEENLKKTLELGGFPMPSIAVTKADIGHTNFGDISVVFRKDTIDPAQKKNKVYGADAWTPTFPRTEYEGDYDRELEIRKTLKEASKGLDSEYADKARTFALDLQDKLNRYGGEEGVIHEALKDKGLQAAYLSQKGNGVNEITREERYEMSDHSVDMAKFALERFGDRRPERAEVREAVRDYYRKEGMSEEEIDKTAEPAFRLRTWMDLYQRYGKVQVKTVKDVEAMNREVEQTIKEDGGYEGWIRNLFRGIEKNSGLYNGKERYTASGEARSFSQTHYPFNVENIVRAMLDQNEDQRNSAGFYGIKSIRAGVTDSFRSVDEIREASDRLQAIDTEAYNRKVDELQNRLLDVMGKITEKRGGESYLYMDYLGEVLMEAAEHPTKQNISRLLKKYQWRATDQEVQELYDIMKEVYEMPVKMFEAKPQRVVGFHEVAAAVVPDTTESELKQQLKAVGMEVLEYKAGDNEDRKAVVNSIEDIRFSLSGISEMDDFWKKHSLENDFSDVFVGFDPVKTSAEHVAGLLEEGQKLLKGKPVETEAIKKIAKDLKKEYQSDVNLEDFSQNLEKVFAYMQSRDHVNYDDMVHVLSEVAKPVIEESTDYEAAEMEQYNKFHKTLYSYKLKLDPVQKYEVAQMYDSYDNFRKENFGKIKLSNNGIYLDEVWQELCDAAGGYLDPTLTPTDQPLALVDAIEQMKPVKRNTFGADEDLAAYDLTIRILESYYDLQSESRLKPMKEKLRQESKAFREKVQQEYQERLKNLKERSKEREERLKAQNEILAQKYKAANLNTKSKVAEAKALYRNSRQEEANRRKAAEARDKIKKTGNKMMRWILEPTDTNYVPDVMKKPVMEFLSGIDFVSHRGQPESAVNQRWNERMQSLKDLLKDAEKGGENTELYYRAISFDPDLPDMMQEFIDNNKDRAAKISQMDHEQLEELNRIMTGLATSISRSRDLYRNKQYQRVSNIAHDTITELKERGRKETDKGEIILEKKAKEFFNLDMVDPLTYFQELGDAPMSIYRELREGFNKKVWHIKDAQDYMEELLKDIDKKELQNWTGANAQVHEIKVQEGTLKMTTGQIMNLYVLMRRQQARLHVLSGGIKPTSFKRGVRVFNDAGGDAIHISMEDYYKMEGLLTEQQKHVAEKMQEYLSTTVSEWGNAVSEELYGYKKFTEAVYWPIKVDKNTTRTTQPKENEGAAYWRLKNMGMTKMTKVDAKNASMIGDIFDVYSDHVADMATYEGMVLPLMDAMKWFNYSELFEIQDKEGGKNYQNGVKGEIERVMGKKGQDYFLTLIRDINGDTPSGYTLEITDKLVSHYKAAQIAANVRVAIQQPTAYARAALLMDQKYLAEALPAIKQAKKLSQKAKEKSAIALWKSWGYYETSMGRSMRDVVTGQSSLLDQVRDKSAILAQMGDDLTWGVLYRAVELETKGTTKLQEGTKEFDEHVVKRFDEVIDQTQVVDTILHRSQIMRSKNGIMKMEMSFMSEPTKSYNMLHRAFMESMRAKGKKKRWKPFGRALTVYFITNLLTSAVAAVSDAIRDDDKEKTWLEKYLAALRDNAFDNLLPFNMIPYVKDIWSMFQGYDSERMDLSAISDAVQAVKNWQKFQSGESKKTLYGMMKDSARAISGLSGIPFYNALREIESVYNVADDTLNHIGEDLPDIFDTQKDYYKNLTRSIQTGEGIRESVSELLESGKEKGDISRNLTTKYKPQLQELYETDRSKAADLKNNLIQAYTAAGYEWDEINKKINSWFEE